MRCMPTSPTLTQYWLTAAVLRWGVSEQRTSATTAGSQRVNASMGVRSRSPLASRGENLTSTEERSHGGESAVAAHGLVWRRNASRGAAGERPAPR